LIFNIAKQRGRDASIIYSRKLTLTAKRLKIGGFSRENEILEEQQNKEECAYEGPKSGNAGITWRTFYIDI